MTLEKNNLVIWENDSSNLWIIRENWTTGLENIGRKIQN